MSSTEAQAGWRAVVKRRSASWWGGPVKGCGSTPSLVYRLVYALLILMSAAGFGGRCLAAEPVRLSLDDPYRDGDYVKVDFTLRGIFDDEIMASLESGLPATLVFEWRIWHQRKDWWDSQVGAGSTHFRVFYDILEDEYDVFDARGRSLAICEAITGVEGVICNREGLRVDRADAFASDKTYYFEMRARLEPLGDQEIRGFESWLSGDEEVGNGETSGGSSSVFSGISRHALGVVKSIAGISERSVTARSTTFRGWNRDSSD